MMKRLSIRDRSRQQPALARQREGGVDDIAARPHGGSAFKSSAIGMLCVGLAALMSLPISASAQGTCTNTPAGAGTPPTVTITTIVAAQVKCTGLTQGLTLTLDTGAQIGTSAGSRATGVTNNAGALEILPGSSSSGDIAVVSRGSIYSSENGIRVYIPQNRTGAISVDLQAGTIVATKAGAYLLQYGTGDITFKTAVGSTIRASGGGLLAEVNSVGSGNLSITHNGKIYTDKIGFLLVNRAAGNVTVTTGADSVIDADSVLDSEGDLVPATLGRGIQAETNGAGVITITHNGMIEAEDDGIVALHTGAGGIMITTAKGSTVTSQGRPSIGGRPGIEVQRDGTGTFDVKIHGTVMGDKGYTSSTKRAGIHVTTNRTSGGMGGTITIGPWGHVGSGSKVAIQVDAYTGPAANPVTIVLEEDDVGIVGHVEGDILNPVTNNNAAVTAGTKSTLKFKTRSASGTDTELTPDAADAIIHRRETTGVYDKVIKAQLKTITGGYRFEDDASAPVLRLYSDRSRQYEVLPSVLLGLVELTPYSTRMAVPRRTTGETVMLESSKGERVAVPRSRMNIWVRVAVRDGERMAKTSTTAQGFRGQSLAWDVRQTDLEAGRDVVTDEGLMMGVSAHYRQGKATVRRGGTVEATGAGMGLSLTWTDANGLYVDGQLAYTRFFDVTMVSSTSSVGTITSTGGGNGLAVGVEVGQPMSLGDMTVTPRGGLSWSSVDLDAFDEPATIDGASRIAPSKEQSVQGRVGVLVELGPAEADSRLYASLDLEHEFSPELEVMAGDARLTAKGKPTWVRVGVGGSMSLGGSDTMMLAGDAFYATAGSDNADFGGGVALTIRF